MAKEFDEEDLFDDDLFADLDFDSTPGSAPPKGVKGYFKNVAKSGKNIIIGFGQNLMPQSTETIRGISDIFGGIKDAFSDRKEKIMRRMQAKKGDSEGVVNALKKSVSDTINDFKEKVKTGNFVKGDDDIDFAKMMEDDTGDEETDSTTWYDDIFGKQDNYDYSQTEEMEGGFEEMSENATPGGGVAMAPMENKINNRILKKTIVQGADTMTLAKMQGNSTIALINAYNANMRQQQIAEEARHREKMLVLTNIQKNQFKSASFLGGMFKSSNEFYRKALRGLIDMHGIMKERREMDIEIYKHEQDVWKDERIGTADVFSSGFNADNWLKGVGNNIKQMFDYSALGELYQANQMMGDMGKMTGKKMSMMSMLLNPFNLISNALVNGSNRIGLQKLDKTVAGLPAIFNNMLMGLSNKGGILGRIGETFAIRDEAGYVDASKYAVRDLKKPTAWDFAARQSLVEVIPGYLSQILSAVSGKEELYYDHQTKQFKTVKSLKSKYMEDRKMAMNSDYEFSNFNSSMKDAIKNEFKKSGSKLNPEEFEKMYMKMMDNMGMMQQLYNTDVAQHDSYYREMAMRGMSSNDTANQAMLDVFNAIMLNPEQFGISRQQIGGFQNMLATFKGNIGRMHRDWGGFETDDSKLMFTQRAIGNLDRVDSIDSQIKRLNDKIKNAKTAGAEAQYRTQLINLQTQRHYLEEIEGFESSSAINKEGKSAYERSLIDASTGSGNILQRIYETLIHGVVVFPQKMPKELWNNRKDIIDYMGQVKAEQLNYEDAKSAALEEEAKQIQENLKERAQAAMQARRGENLGSQLGLQNLAPIRWFNKLLGSGIDKINDKVARHGLGGDSQRYGGVDANENDTTADENWDKSIGALDKLAKREGFIGSAAKWLSGKVKNVNEKRKEYSYKEFKDGEEALNRVTTWGRGVWNNIKGRFTKPVKKEELVSGVDTPLNIKPKRGGLFNGTWVVLVTEEDWTVLKKILDKGVYNYTSATEGVDGLHNVKGVFMSEKFRNSGDYNDFIKDVQKLKKEQEGRFIKIFYQIDGPHGLKYYLENEPKITIGKALSSEVVNEINASTFEETFMNRDRGKQSDNIFMGGGSYTTVKSEHKIGKVDNNLDILTSNFRNIEGQLDRIINLMDNNRYDTPVEVQNMEEVISLLTIISNKTNEGGGTINLKDIEKAFNRQRKAGKKEKKGNIATRILGTVIKAPFKAVGWGAKTAVKGIGFALGLIPNLLGGLIGGIAGGIGKSLPGIGNFLGSTLGLLGNGAATIAKGIGGIGGKILGVIPKAGRLLTKGLGKAWDATKWAGGKIAGAAGWVKDKATGALSWAGNKIKGAATWMKDKGFDKIKGAGRWVKDKATGAWKWVKKKASVVGNTLKDTVHNVAGNIGKYAGKLGKGIAKFAGGIVGSFTGAFAGPFWKKAMLENTVQIRMMLEKEYGAVDPSALTAAMKSYGGITKIGEGVTKMVGAAKDKLKSLPGAMKDKLGGVKDWAGGKLSGAKGIISNNIETMQIQAMLLADAMKEKAGNVKKKFAGFIDRGDGSGIREGSAEDQKKDKQEKEAAARAEEMHAASLTTAAATTALLDKDFGGGKDATGGGIQALGTFLSMGAASLGKRGLNFVKNIFKGGKKAKAGKGLFKTVKQMARIKGRKIAAFGRGLVKQAKNFKTLFTQGGKLSGVTKTLGRIGKMVANTRVGKAVVGVAKPIAKIGKWIIGLLGKLFKNKTIIKKLGPKTCSTLAKTLPGNIIKGLTKAGGKTVAKLTAKIGTAATGVGAFALAAFEIVTGVYAFTKNWLQAGQLFGLQPGEKPTLAMRATAGIVGALNNLLVGIPSLIFGMDGLVQMVYKLVVGSLPDENRWKEERAKIYGIMKNWQQFDMNYPAPGTNLFDRIGFKRIGSKIAGSFAKWMIFGFQSKKIYDKWKKERFQPLKELEDKIVDSYGGSKGLKNNADDFQAYQDAFRKAADECIKANNAEHLNTDTKDTKEPKKLNGLAPAMSGGMAAAALTGAVTGQASEVSGGEGTSPNATGGNIEPGSAKQGILQKAISFASKNKGKLLLLGLLGPGALLLTKGAQLAWKALKSGVKFVGDKIGSFVDWVSGKSSQALGTVQDKVMEMIQAILAGASSVSDGFKMAFDIIKSYIARFTESGADRVYQDDAYQYGLSYNKNKTVLKEKFGINGPEEMPNLKMSEAVWIYYSNYYDKMGKMNELTKNDRVLAYHYFHHAMDAGKDIADQMMKQCEKLDPALRAHCFVQLRLNYYRELAQKDKDKKTMLPFWERNVLTLNKELGFEFKEGQSYDTEIDSKTESLAKESSYAGGSGVSPNATSNGYNAASSMEVGSNTSNVSSTSVDNPDLEDVGQSITGGGGSSSVSYSTAFGGSSNSSGMVGGGNSSIINKTPSMDFKNLEDFIKKELEYLENIQVNTNNAVIAIAQLNQTMVDGFNKLIEAMSRNNRGTFGLAEQIAEGVM